MIKREITKKIREVAKYFPVISITGPRQSGKTTLARNEFSDLPYVSLEESDNRRYAQSDPRGFLSEYKEGAVFDEVQHVPELFSYLQSVVDETDLTGRFILTGSQNFLLLEKITQSLAGRVGVFKLLPFSLPELNRANINIDDALSYIFNGSYPRCYDKNIPPGIYFPSYIQTYIDRDVRQIKNITDLNLFSRFIRLCAARTGQLLNLSSIATDCGISHSTARSWLSILEASYIIYLLKPHHSNFNKRLVKMPKLYFYDSGLLCSLLGIININQLRTHYLRGGLFENMVISEILKYYFNRGIEPPVYFWRDKHGHEIDCLIDMGDDLLP
ncbi:MAG: ATP-binding protein, partial [Bacteroidales bacterium]|nr:ATP-binding protein [Bacteroidales bacterium]